MFLKISFFSYIHCFWDMRQLPIRWSTDNYVIANYFRWVPLLYEHLPPPLYFSSTLPPPVRFSIPLIAAFDFVDHNILIQKLDILGFEECTLSWVSSYLSSRSQQVWIEGSLSDPLPLEAEVPQGSILGPLLYMLLAQAGGVAVGHH